MKAIFAVSTCYLTFLLFFGSCGERNTGLVSVPVSIDHNRILIDAEMRRKDGTWRKARLWVDSGNPVFMISAELADDLGFAPAGTVEKDMTGTLQTELRISGMMINTDSIPAIRRSQPYWLYSTMHCDGNLPSAILKKYNVVFDYPKRELTIAEPGLLKHEGIKSDAIINPENGIVQLRAVLDGDTLSLALDFGASYSFISDEILSEYASNHPDRSEMTGTAGYANMWGWWPENEQLFTVVRIAGMQLGTIEPDSFGIVGVPRFGHEGPTLGEWYSRKTFEPVSGFLGANVLKPYRIEIDYINHAVWFQRDPLFNEHDMDIVGISMRQLPDSTYQVSGVVKFRGKPVIEGITEGDTIISIDNLKVKGETMGKVVDALRGNPGDLKTILISRNGLIVQVNATVMKLL